MALWYYVRAGQQAGPLEAAALLAMIARGDESPSLQVWREGMADWLPASDVPELGLSQSQSGYSQTSSYPQPAAYQPAGTGQSAWGYPQEGQPYPLPYDPGTGHMGHARRSGGMTAVGVINIILGSLFTLCMGFTSLVVVAMPDKLGNLSAIDKVIPFFSLVLNIGLLASGLGTLLRRKWAQTITWIIAGPIVLLYGYNFVTSLSQRPTDGPGPQQVGFVCGLVLSVGLGMGWPIFLLFFYQRPSIKRQWR